MARLFFFFFKYLFKNKIKINLRRWKQLGFSSVEIARYLVHGSIMDFARKKDSVYYKERIFALCKQIESKNLFSPNMYELICKKSPFNQDQNC